MPPKTYSILQKLKISKSFIILNRGMTPNFRFQADQMARKLTFVDSLEISMPRSKNVHVFMFPRRLLKVKNNSSSHLKVDSFLFVLKISGL